MTSFNIAIGATIEFDYDGPARLHRLTETHWRVHRLDQDHSWATTANIEQINDDEYPWWIYPPFPTGENPDQRSGFRQAVNAALDYEVPTDPDYS